MGWGDGPGGRSLEGLWAGDMIERAGEHLDYIAIHMMGQVPLRKDSVLRSLRYQSEPDQAWDELMEMAAKIEERVAAVESILAAKRFSGGIAITEGHLSLPPHNANPILYEWLTGVYHARVMNIYQRHGARVKIATAADFCGTRWTVNGVMLEVPRGISYLMPVASVMRLFRRYSGTDGVTVTVTPSGLDVAGSRRDGHIYLHVANTNHSRDVDAALSVQGMRVTAGTVYEIAPKDPREYVSPERPDALAPRRHSLPVLPAPRWTFLRRSVTAIELICE